MKKILLTILIFFVPFFLQADNWELFPPNQVTYFHFTGEDMDAISPFYVDVVETMNEAEYQYILRNYMDELSGECYENLAQLSQFNIYIEPSRSHFPNEVMVLQDGWYGETVFEANPTTLPHLVFNTEANPGDKWIIESEHFQDFDQIEIECISFSIETFLEVEDIVKTFHLQALQNGNLVSSEFNSIAFKVSEKYGLISGIPLKELLQNEPTTQMQLAGFEDESGDLHGRKAYTFLDFIPNFQAGDILKWQYTNLCRGFGSYGLNSIFRDSITAVVKTDESLQYYFERKTEEEIYDFATETALPPTYSTVIDTFTYFADTFREFRYTLDLAYYGLGFMGENASTYHRIVALQSSKQTYEITNQVLPNLTIVYDGLEQYDCEIQQLTDVSFQHSFNQSVGFNKKDSHCFGAFSETLIGYRIGNEESGDIEPIITNIESPTYFALQITLHPNPTNNRFTLRLKNPKQQTKNLQLKITDIHGRTLQQLPLLQASIEVDLSDQPNGIYLVQISDGKNWWTEKVVKY